MRVYHRRTRQPDLIVKSAQVRTTTGLVSSFRFGSLGLVIIGTQLNGNPTYLGPAIVFALIDFILPIALAVEVGHRGRCDRPSLGAPNHAGCGSAESQRVRGTSWTALGLG